jgi:hypothetical protein
MQQVDAEVDRPSGVRPPRNWVLLLLVCAIAAGVVFLVFAGMLPAMVGGVAVALVLTAFFWVLRSHLHSILLVFVGVLLAGAIATQRVPKMRADRLDADEGERLAGAWKASGRFNENLPVVVHLVFDEMMSVGAMTDDLPRGAATRQALLEFSRKHSFRTFGSVYSRYYYTSDALPNLMNREYLGRMSMDSFSEIPFNPTTRSYRLEPNAYFDNMAARGYRTAVFQTTYMNFCANRSVDLCESFDSFDPVGKAAPGVDAPTQRVRMWQTFLRAYEPSYTSELGQQILGRVYGLKTGDVGVIGDEGGRYDVQRFPQWFDRFTRFVATVPRGTHVFAHFLVPHSPYLLLESCVVSGKVDTGYNLSQYPAGERAEQRRDHYDRYLAQLRCVMHKLDDLIAKLDASDQFRDAVIVIHGDHGSRISSGETLEDYAQRDFVDNYAAFFAIRSPGIPPGVDCEFVSLPEVFRRYMARPAERKPRSGAPPPVVVLSRGAGNTKVEAPMPRFGCSGMETTAP